MSEPSLEELSRSAARGGKRELDTLLEALRPLVCRWALVWTGSPDSAEDVAQQVLIKVHSALKAGAETRRFTTWTYQITRHVLIDQERRRGSRQKLEDRLRIRELAWDGQVSTDGRPDARKLLERLMDELSPRQRAILDLVDLQGYAPTEVADMLNLAPDTVRVHLHRARKALKHRGDAAGRPPADEGSPS